MKQLLFIFITVFAYSFETSAQKGVQIGLKIIPQNTWMFNWENSKDADFNAQPTFRLAFGGSVDYHFHELVGIGLDVIYSTQGQKYEDAYGFDFRYNVNYVKLPILVNFNSKPGKIAMFYGQFGPQLSILTDAKRLAGGNSKEAMDIRLVYHKVNFGAVLGLGVAFNLPKNFILTAGVRVDGEFTNAVAVNSYQTVDIWDRRYAKFQQAKFLLPFNQNWERSPTYNFTTGIEVGFKYVINKKIKLVVY